MARKVSLKRRSARISARYRRKSTEQLEIKKKVKQLIDDQMDVISISSDDTPNHSHADESERPQNSNQSDESSCSNALDLMNISGYLSEKSANVAMEEHTGCGIEMGTTVTGEWSSIDLTNESSTDGANLQDFLGIPPSSQNSVSQNDAENADDDCYHEEEAFEIQTANGRNGTVFCQSRSRKQSTKEVQNYVPTKRFFPSRPFQPQNDFWTQPNVLKCVRESSELHVIQLFNNCLVSAAKQQDVETVQRPQTIESEPHQSPLAQPSNEDETGINTVNSAYASNLKEFLGQPPARQVSNDEQEEEQSDEEQADQQEEEGWEDDSDDEEVKNRTAATENGTMLSQTSKRRSRKQSRPKKRRDNVSREIIKYQSSRKLLIPRLPFQRVVHEVMQQFKNDFRLQSEALECLRESSEAYLVQLFEDANLCCYHRSRITLNVKDMRLVQVVRGSNPGRK